MTILPSKPKKTGSKGTVQSSGRAPVGGHTHVHHPSANANDCRKTGSCNGPTAKLSSQATQLLRNSSAKLASPKHPYGGSGGLPECNKQPQLLRVDGSPGCNSDDEYGPGFKDENMEVRFEERLRRMRGFVIKQMRGDGACLFRAVADQVYGDEDMHVDVRRLCLDYMEMNRDHFSQFVTEDFATYLARKRRHDAHGNHIEMQAISEIFSRPIEIYEYTVDPKNIFTPRSEHSPSSLEPNPPIRLSYHGGVHYNSVIDPLNATIGVGLGLPGYCPGSADRSLMRDAMRKSEIQQIEEAMLNDKMKMTDFELTEKQINEQIARESYIDYLKSLEEKKENSQRSLAGAKRSTSADCQPCCSRTPVNKIRPREIRYEAKACSSKASVGGSSPPQQMSFYEELIASSTVGMSEWDQAAENDADESALLAQVMALSQQEFLNSLKRNSQCSRSDFDQAGSSKSS